MYWQILTAEKISKILINEISKAFTLKSFAMLVEKPCNIAFEVTCFCCRQHHPVQACRLEDCLGSGIEDLCTRARSSNCIGLYRCIFIRSCNYLIVVRCIPAKLSATFTKKRLRFESCIRVTYWHWLTATMQIALTIHSMEVAAFGEVSEGIDCS